MERPAKSVTGTLTEGFVFYDKGNNSGGWRYLEAAPVDLSLEGESFNIKWASGGSVPEARGTAIGTGKTNTAAIIKRKADDETAAKLAADYRGGGKSDWFLPSKDELVLLYEYFHEARFNESEDGGFIEANYWSSSEYNIVFAWYLNFLDGEEAYFDKLGDFRVRAVRAF